MCKIDLMHYKKGQVWMMRGEKWTTEQRDMGITISDRPVIVVGDVNVCGKYVTVVPVTSNSHSRNGVFVRLEPDTLSTVLVQEIRPVPANTLFTFLGSISDRVMDEIDLALKVYLGFEKDPELVAKYFKYSTNKRGDVFSIIREVDDNAKNNTKPEPIILNLEEKGSVPEKKTRKKPTMIDFNTLSDDDKKFIMDNKVSEIAKKFNVCSGTVYRWRKLLPVKDTNSDNNKSEDKPKIISTTKYSNRVYKSFQYKKIAKFTNDDKRLFAKMDSCKLSTNMNVPLNLVCAAQAEFRKELNIK